MKKTLLIFIIIFAGSIAFCLAGRLVVPDLSDDNISSIKETFARQLKSEHFVQTFIGKAVKSDSIEVQIILPVFNFEITPFVLSESKEVKLEDFLTVTGYYSAVISSDGKAIYLLDCKIVDGELIDVGGMGAGEWTDAILEFEKKRQLSDTKHAFILNAFPVMKLVRITTDDQVEIYSMNPPGHESSNTIQGLKDYLKVYFQISE